MEFSYKNLTVWNRSLDLAVSIINLVGELELPRKHYRLIEQIEASATSVAANIAEGKGRRSKKEYIQFLYISRGSLYEAMAILEIFYRNSWVDKEKYYEIEKEGLEIASMLMGLIKSIYKAS